MKIVYPDGSMYVGHVLNGKENGSGKFSYSNGDEYDGHWTDGEKYGKGEYKYLNGNVYSGEWEENKKNGSGTLRYFNGAEYKGTWVYDEAKYGKYVDEKGTEYEVKDGKHYQKNNENLTEVIESKKEKFGDAEENLLDPDDVELKGKKAENSNISSKFQNKLLLARKTTVSRAKSQMDIL
jgi:hypothetical protein